MADRENALGKKTIIAIIAVIVLLFIAGISVGIFLADKGSSEAVDGNQVADVNQNTDANNTNTENQKNDDNNVNSENKQNENIQAENNNNQTGENSTPDNTNIATKPDTGVQNNVTTPNNNDGTVANNGTTNNNVTANNGETDNNVTNNTEITTGTNVNEVGETTVTRVEEEEKLVSKDFWDWWTPASVLATAASAVSDTIVPTTPDFTVEKFATTKSGENVVYAGENITYTIKVTNNGEKDLNNIEITDKIPENTTFVSFDDAFNIIKGKTVIGENDEVVGVKWIVSIPGHKENEDANSVFVRFTVNVNKMMLVEMDDGEIAEVPTTGTIANTAIANGQESNEEKTAIITSNKTSEITRDGNKVEVAKIGDEITYTIKVTNTGEVDGVTTISDNVPTGTILKENSAEGAIISENNTKLEWKNVTVPAGESVSKTFIVIVDNFDDSTENKITNVATVGGKETDEVEDPIAIDITVSKDWKDANDQDGYRPEEIYVNLLTDGKVKTTVEVKADEQGNWSYVFENLPKFENGKEIVYTVTENDVEKYTTEITGSVAEGFVITNRHTPELVNETGRIEVSKDWKDENDQDGYRPEEIYVNLLTDGKVKTTVEVKADEQGNWSYVFENLPKFENGKEIVYTVTENDVEKYTTEITGSVAEGFVITNRHTPELVNETGRIEVSKDWKDENDQDGYRPEEIYVNLLTDGKVKTTVEVKADEQGNWSYVFENLPKFENGKEIVYTVTENDVEKYTTEITGSVAEGFVITNRHTPELVNETGRIEVSKDWKDENDQDGYRPEEIYVNLLTDGKVKTTVEVKADEQGNWSYVFENLPKFENGKEIVYTVTENDVEKYTTEITGSVAEGFVITNRHTPELVNETGRIEVSKDWKDENDQDGYRPEEIYVNLLTDGKVKTTVEVKADEQGNWSYVFENLPKFENGKEIVYTVTENDVEKYTTEITGSVAEGFVITNRHTPELVNETGRIEVSKDWKDENDQDGYRPEEIYVNLLTDGKVKTTVEVKADEQGNWSYVFENLPKFENGKEIVYTVTENDVEKYTTEITGSVAEGFVITNRHTPELVNETGRIEVSKDWKDENDQDGYRPEEIYVNLLTDGKVKTTVEVKADEQGNWSYVFENLPKFENGKEIVYTVTENDVEKYTTEITGSVAEGFVITNRHTPELVNETGRIEVSKDWKDENDQDGYRPEEIYVNLLTDGKVKTTVEVKADEQGNWSYVFENLPKFENGKEIVYTVTENDVEKYTTEITGSVAEGFVITNRYTPELVNETGRIEVSKDWKDENDQDGYRPEEIYVNLLTDGKVKTTVEVKADEQGNWSYVFENLPKFENGKEIVYTVTENDVEKYTTEITGSVAEGFVITNTHTPTTKNVVLTKIWDDNGNELKKRPGSVTFRINNKNYVLSALKDEDKTTLNEWTLTVKVPINNTDTVSEVPVKGYTTIYGEDGLTVTNQIMQPGKVTINSLKQSSEKINAPMDVVFVLDTSNSMSEKSSRYDENNKAQNMVNAVNNTISNIMSLNPDSRVGIVGYAGWKENNNNDHSEHPSVIVPLDNYKTIKGNYISLSGNVINVNDSITKGES
ncbi:MAG: Cna B-type domain-containing protein [Clostridia bacterium]